MKLDMTWEKSKLWANRLLEEIQDVDLAAVDAQEKEAILCSEAYTSMPDYPNAGSVARIGEVIVVKIGKGSY